MKHLRPVSCQRAQAITDLYFRLARLKSDFWYALKFEVPVGGGGGT